MRKGVSVHRVFYEVIVMDLVIAQCHHSSHAKLTDEFLRKIATNPSVHFMSLPDALFKEGETHIDHQGSIGDPSTYKDIPDQSVSAYVNVFCAQQVPNIQAGLSEIDRTLKPGGYYVFSRMLVPEVVQPLNMEADSFFRSKGYTKTGPLVTQIKEGQSLDNIQRTGWYFLQKPKTSGTRSKRKTRKTSKK